MSNNNRRTKGRFHLIGLAAALAVLALVFAALFFLNPDICSSSWFRAKRTFFASIGDHDFYI